MESDVVSLAQRLAACVYAVLSDDLTADPRVEVCVVRERELILVRGEYPLQGVAHKQELVISLQTVSDLGRRVTVETRQIFSLQTEVDIGADEVFGTRHVHFSRDREKDALPVGARDLRDLAVDEA